ncbi:TPA: hypothetical protein EYP38_04330, partial [Candidatus Micrarchaeota archaeon]|nr:hypothetical protein [Candidatus Micrarchaeota archaeon]
MDKCLLPSTVSKPDVDSIVHFGRQSLITFLSESFRTGLGGKPPYRHALLENPTLLRHELSGRPEVTADLLAKVSKSQFSSGNRWRAKSAMLLASIAMDSEVHDLKTRKQALEQIALSSPGCEESRKVMQWFGFSKEKLWSPSESLSIAYIAAAGSFSLGAGATITYLAPTVMQGVTVG